MKAYVIKNKEGKYLAVSSSDYEHYWTTIDFAHYFRFLNATHDAKAEAEEYRNGRYPDCEVVEITILEGNLEQQLAEKDKEIERLNIDIAEMERQDEIFVDMFEEQIRHEVCGEIRNYIHTNDYDQFGLEYLMDGGAILNKLDQIEKGE